jgi:hypothetical protein
MFYPLCLYAEESGTVTPVNITTIFAEVVGGISELGEMVDGFKLQVAIATPKLLSASPRDSDEWLSIAASSKWETILEFSAPCASGKAGKLISWHGWLKNVAAIRIAAPSGRYVDGSKVWIEY